MIEARQEFTCAILSTNSLTSMICTLFHTRYCSGSGDNFASMLLNHGVSIVLN